MLHQLVYTRPIIFGPGYKQGDKTNGFEMEGLEGVVLEREKLGKEGVKDLYFF